jgi:hypothetical protein
MAFTRSPVRSRSGPPTSARLNRERATVGKPPFASTPSKVGASNHIELSVIDTRRLRAEAPQVRRRASHAAHELRVVLDPGLRSQKPAFSSAGAACKLCNPAGRSASFLAVVVANAVGCALGPLRECQPTRRLHSSKCAGAEATVHRPRARRGRSRRRAQRWSVRAHGSGFSLARSCDISCVPRDSAAASGPRPTCGRPAAAGNWDDLAVFTPCS